MPKDEQNQSLSHVPTFPYNTYPAGMTASGAGLSRQELIGTESAHGDLLAAQSSSGDEISPTTSGLMLTVRGTPRAKARGRAVGGRIVSTTNAKEKLWRAAVERAAREAVQNAGGVEAVRAMLAGGVAVDAVWWFETSKAERWGRPHLARPDKDNLEKLVLDALTKAGALGGDDCRAAGGSQMKLWAQRGGMAALVRPIGPPILPAASIASDWLRGV
jgi:Holliday junction resolvase RusA-like endonuclease